MYRSPPACYTPEARPDERTPSTTMRSILSEPPRSWLGRLAERLCSIFDPSISIEPVALRGLGTGKPPRVELAIANDGRTAARELTTWGACFIEPFTKSGDLGFPIDRIKMGEPQTLPRGARITVDA